MGLAFYLNVFAIIVIFICVGIYNVTKNAGEKSPANPRANQALNLTVYKRRNLLTSTEYNFWKVLREKCGNQFIICPKVRMEDFLSVDIKNNRSQLMRYRGYIKARHIDFILCDNMLHIIAGIELDDASHNKPSAQKSDMLKNDIFRAINLPLYRVKTSAGNYANQIESILAQLRPPVKETK